MMKHSTRPNNKKYIMWRKLVLERDKYICQYCKIEDKKIIHVHHIIEWDENESLRYEVSNGLTLCSSCHNKHHFLGKESPRKGVPCDEKTAARLRSYNNGRASWNKGKSWSKESKEKMRVAKLGKKASLQTKEKMSIVHKGKSHTKETILKMSQIKKGKKFSKEHKAKLSKARIGIKLSDSHKLALKNAKTDKIIQENKIRLKGKKWIIDPDTGKRKWID